MGSNPTATARGRSHRRRSARCGWPVKAPRWLPGHKSGHRPVATSQEGHPRDHHEQRRELPYLTGRNPLCAAPPVGLTVIAAAAGSLLWSGLAATARDAYLACMTDEPRETRVLTYIGRPAWVGELHRELTDAGAQADYDPPMERKDFAEYAREVAVELTVTGTTSSLLYAVARFKERFGSARVEGLPQPPAASIEDRLAQLGDLRDRGVITDEEYVAKRSRIINEL